MLRYLLKRIMVSIPTLLVISLAVFGLGKCAPGDPVDRLFNSETEPATDLEGRIASYRRNAEQLGLDRPVFYFSFGAAAFPDTVWKIYPADRRQRLWNTTAQTGNWQASLQLEAAVEAATKRTVSLPDSVKNKAFLYAALVSLSQKYRLDQIDAQMLELESVYQGLGNAAGALQPAFETLRTRVQALRSERQTYKLYLPAFHWYGCNNQYHHWISGFLTGDWGVTNKGKPVWGILKPSLYASLAFNGIALLLAYLIAIPLGVEMARRKGRAFDRWAQRALVFLHAMPVFWLGTLLAQLLCGSVFGKPLIANPYLDISSMWQPDKINFWPWFSDNLPRFVLPILVLMLYAVTTLTVQMRSGMLETLNTDYIRTARAKGVKEEDVYWLHAFQNALFPLITLFASVFPAVFTGSLVIESMFNFPGMGMQAQNAFTGHELTILLFILMAAATMTIVGGLIADVLYAVVDPRVRYVQEK